MEHNKVEAAVIAEAVSKCVDEQVRDLDDLQLAMVGGGGADIVIQ